MQIFHSTDVFNIEGSGLVFAIEARRNNCEYYRRADLPRKGEIVKIDGFEKEVVAVELQGMSEQVKRFGLLVKNPCCLTKEQISMEKLIEPITFESYQKL